MRSFQGRDCVWASRMTPPFMTLLGTPTWSQDKPGSLSSTDDYTSLAMRATTWSSSLVYFTQQPQAALCDCNVVTAITQR